MLMLGNNGLINKVLMTLQVIGQSLSMLYTEPAVIVVMIYIYLLSFPVRPVRSVEAISKPHMEAAYDLGANRHEVFQ